jgi:hypothetical protein
MNSAVVISRRALQYSVGALIAILCRAVVTVNAQTAGPANGGTVSVNFNVPIEPNVATLTALYQDSAGAGDIQKADLYVTPSIPGNPGAAANACVAEWRNTGGMGSLVLVNDAGTAFSSYSIPVGAGGAAGGEQVRVTNSQCVVRSEQSTMAFVDCPQPEDGPSCLSVTFEINFGGSPLGGGTYDVYLIAQDGQGLWSTNYQTPFGSISVPASRIEPCYSQGYNCTVSANPPDAASTTFTVDYFDSNGVAELTDVVLHILDVAPGSVAGWSSNGCIIQYIPSSNTFQVAVDAGGSFGGTSNSQCSVLSASVQQNGGTDLILAMQVQFSSSFAGTHNLYLEADRLNPNNTLGNNLNFQNIAATYTVP